MLDSLRLELTYAARSLRRASAFTLTAVLILAVGIGMAVAMFTVVRTVLVQALPVVDQDQLVVLWTVNQNGMEWTAGKKTLDAFRRVTRTLHDVAGVVHWGATEYPLESRGRTILVQQAIVTGNFFQVLGARPVLGRLLTSDDEVGGRFQADSFAALPHAMVLSFAAWQDQFGGDSSVIGGRLTDPYSRWTYTVVGVAPPGLDYPAGVSEWVPIGRDADLSMITIGRLRAGVTPAAALSDYLGAMRRLDNQKAIFPGARVRTLPDVVSGDVRPVLLVLSAAVGLLLLVACINVGNLLLLRATGRTREMAIRRAIGASYGALLRQLLVEAGVLAALGGILGFACAEALVRMLVALAPAELPRMDTVRLAGAPVLAAIGITAAAVLCFGLVPALLGARADVAHGLRPNDRSGRESRRSRRTRELLVAWQLALALIMVTTAGLLGRSLTRLQNQDLGLRPENLDFFALSLPAAHYTSQDRVNALGDALFPRLREIPGVVAVTPVLIPPFFAPSAFQMHFQGEGETPTDADRDASVGFEAVGPEYFRTLGIPILRGRSLSGPGNADAPLLEVVISESVARRYWPGRDPIGRFSVGGPGAPRYKVVGVVPDIHYRELRAGTPTVFLPWRQVFWQGNVAIRTSRDFATVLPAIRRVVHELDPDVLVWQTASMDQLMAGPLAEPRASALLMSGFGLVALLLAAIGLYGVMASIVRQQTREIGVRMALGATPALVRRTVLARSLQVLAVGTVLGLAGAGATVRLYKALLFQVGAGDPTAFGGAIAVLLLVGLIAAFVPAQRATAVDPARALRME